MVEEIYPFRKQGDNICNNLKYIGSLILHHPGIYSNAIKLPPYKEIKTEKYITCSCLQKTGNKVNAY